MILIFQKTFGNNLKIKKYLHNLTIIFYCNTTSLGVSIPASL